MSARGIRIARTAVLSLLVLLAALLGFAWWATSTRNGAEWTFERLGAAFPGELRVRELHGSIRSPLTVTGFRYETDRLQISAARVAILLPTVGLAWLIWSR